MTKKIQHSKVVGAKKSVKNVAIVWGIPALLVLVNGYAQWVPEEYHGPAAPIIGLIAYYIKNYLQNK